MIKRVIRLLIVSIMLTTTISYEVVSATGSTELQNQINSNNEKINELEQRKSELASKEAAINSEVQEILNKVMEKNLEIEESNKNIEIFQVKIDELQVQIDAIQSEIESKELSIKDKENEIAQKEEEAIKREELLGNRLRGYYKNDMNGQFLNMLFNSDSISELISNITNIGKILNMDGNLLNEIKETKSELEEEKLSLENEIDSINKQKREVQLAQNEQINAQKEFVDEKEKNEAQMAELNALEQEKQAVLDSLNENERQIQEQIGDLNSYNSNLQSEIDSLFKSINSSSTVINSSVSSGGFVIPAGGAISSEYGPRVHPIFGTNGYHTGIDFASANNSPIYSWKSGTVVFAGVQSGYGNTVIVDHGNGIQTLYAHASSVLVKKGQAVSAGEVIAKVGSTGNSTGPHLHFEVRVNGNHTNPRPYLGL